MTVIIDSCRGCAVHELLKSRSQLGEIVVGDDWNEDVDDDNDSDDDNEWE